MTELNKELLSLISEVAELIDKEITTFNTTEGKIVANIKYYGQFDIPDKVVNENIQFSTNFLLEDFKDALESKNWKDVENILNLKNSIFHFNTLNKMNFKVYQYGRMGGWLSICDEYEVEMKEFEYGNVHKMNYSYNERKQLSNEQVNEELAYIFGVETNDEKEELKELLEEHIGKYEQRLDSVQWLCDGIENFVKKGGYKEYIEKSLKPAEL